MIMLLITVINLFRTKTVEFPIVFWLPWILYMAVYLVVDFSFLGLQLTFQYTLPILIGVVASGLVLTEEDIKWLFKWFGRLCITIYAMFVYGYFLKGGYGPSAASTTMLFTVPVSIFSAFWFMTRGKIYLLLIGIIFLASVLQMTRMGIAATSAVFILHFANNSLKGKILFGVIGILAFLAVFNSKPFQEKTFYGGKGTLEDLTLNYYDNPDIRSSGRISWKKALEPGLRARPVWGNGPRADNAFLSKITRMRGGEAHNDYLSVRFNYGYVGLSLLLFGFAGTFISLYKVSRRNSESYYIRLLSTSTLTLYISFLMFMYTDNILKYTIYFPNYFFALIGIVYNLKRNEDISGNTAIQ
ncbi:MAG TPA: hypothetical protein DDW27_08295 [Bacteroidales bacterium]|nr:hypothetical protein [Bacteroidales bacterium]